MSVELLQVIKPTGEYLEEMEAEISGEELKRLYRLMVLVRNLDIRGLGRCDGSRIHEHGQTVLRGPEITPA